MALAQDLMGLGQAGPFAARVATGGVGPITMAASPGGLAGAAPIMGGQFVIFVNSGTGGIVAPSPGGLTGPLVYDNVVIHNGTGSTITVYPPPGVTVNISGVAITQASPGTLATLRTITLWTGPTATQWFGLLN
jgi:hypothetical protein